MRLLEPIKIGSLNLENRMVMLATHLSYCEAGFVSDQLVEFYEERARHRPGMIIVGGMYTEHLGMSTPTMIGISSDDHIDGLSRLVKAIHKYDVPVAAQLYHAGRYAHSLVLGEQAVSASPVTCRLTRETPRELTVAEIKQTVKNFGLATTRAATAGFDAVEILGSAGYLLNQFLASSTNQRNDEYGGNLEARANFALEVTREVVSKFDNHGPVIYRISGDDFVEGGNTLNENKLLVQWLVESGIDCINVTGGWHETRVPQITMDVPRGHYAYLAEAIADVVDVPVIACNRINSPSVAERILSREKAELIGMSRGFIADPELPDKIRTGNKSAIRPCIGCNLGCLDNVFMIEPITCAINPQAGYESSRQLGSRGTGHIAVLGAGPAGLEASRVLRLRGYEVTLYEEDDTPGGLLRLAAQIPGRGEFAAYISHMWKEMRRLGVDLRFGTRAEQGDIIKESFDAVVCATGTLPGAPPIDGVEQPHVTTSYDVINLAPENLCRVAVIGGSALGCYTALFLSTLADSVHIFDREDALGTDLGRTSRWVIMKALSERGVVVHKGVEVKDITRKYLVIEENGESTLFSVDSVVSAVSPNINDRLFKKLKESGINVHRIGSVKTSMNLLMAVHEAYDFANTFTL
ncbi:MAG: NAD(P)/FAD-dependent oxidoreductase [Candidatus Thorarchaeota archaeon]